MSQFQAKVVEHSHSSTSVPDLLTMQVSYPRMIHSEVMTHRVFSRNASSSRAIPVAKVIKQVWNDPAMPVHWGQNQPSMQAKQELSGFKLVAAKFLWRTAAKVAASIAWGMNKVGLHKQVANRILEPFQIIHVIITSSEWSNFDELRDHSDADPNIQTLARVMKEARKKSIPTIRSKRDAENSSGWHLPYITEYEREMHFKSPLYLAKLSAARCARVSYLNHDGSAPDPAKDLKLYERLVGSRPIHASPVEHQAYPDVRLAGSLEWLQGDMHGNFTGWVQHRKIVEQSL